MPEPTELELIENSLKAELENSLKGEEAQCSYT
jgi:hypothetical protein